MRWSERKAIAIEGGSAGPKAPPMVENMNRRGKMAPRLEMVDVGEYE